MGRWEGEWHLLLTIRLVLRITEPKPPAPLLARPVRPFIVSALPVHKPQLASAVHDRDGPPRRLLADHVRAARPGRRLKAGPQRRRRQRVYRCPEQREFRVRRRDDPPRVQGRCHGCSVVVFAVEGESHGRRWGLVYV